MDGFAGVGWGDGSDGSGCSSVQLLARRDEKSGGRVPRHETRSVVVVVVVADVGGTRALQFED